ncbi:unnamed protein product [Paramecium pentaurelia]|uniref:Uncharacterized protein n=1 Tax=Paramecium pentaurelia TaxID=43138 RepID=A0A8S1UYD0_9CILI|nr:unnamed protein product [Paramecium pentaurelia]
MYKVSKEQLREILASGLTQNPQDSMNEFNTTKRFEDFLKCNITQGLSDNEIKQRQEVFGINQKENLDSISFLNAFCIILLQLKSIFFLTLSLIAFILKYLSTQGIYTNEWIESLFIFGLIFLNLIISAIHLKIDDNNKKKLLIQDEQLKQVKVLRNGQEQNIIARDLVVGDIVILQDKDKIYADGLIVEQNNLEIDECYLTGEQDLIHKITLEEANQQKQPILPQKHLIFSESRVINGNGKLLVLGVGIETQASRIQICIKQENNNTPIQSTIENISSKMETIGFVGAIIVIFMLLARYMIQYHDSKVNGYSTFSNILNLIIVLISGNASKALITHYQLQLAQTVKLMLYSQNLVRNLNQLENLPFMDQLLIDKTGTLTQNRMALNCFMNDNTEELTKSRFNQFPQEFQQVFIDSCFINNQYIPETDQGSYTDKELYQISQEMRINLEERKKQVTHIIPFNSARKRLTSIINNNRVVVKGAAEIIFQQSTKFYSLKNGIVAIDDFLRDDLEQHLIQLSQEGRTIAIAYTDVNLQNENVNELIQNNQFQFDRQNLTLLGFFQFSDPLRMETKMTVEGLKQAGVKVVMITGDNSVTAKSIAIKAGIMSLDSIITEGAEFTQRIQNKAENFSKYFEDIFVLSRARPEDKYNFVKELQELGHVVGVCGDGTNDAPAISKSDVGFSMGISGTEIARESSGIILLDDNIHSIYKGLILARNLLDSIKRLAQYQITSHFSLIIILIASSAIGDAVISPLQFIWINLITDIFATFALSYCRPSSQLYHQNPPNKNGFLLDFIVYLHIIILAIYIITVCIIFINQSLMVFNLFVMTTLFNLINSRMVYLELNVFSGFFGSWMIYTSILIIGLLQFLIVEYGGIIMQTFDGLNLKQWLICIAVGIGSVIWRTIAILIIRPIIKSEKQKLKVS